MFINGIHMTYSIDIVIDIDIVLIDSSRYFLSFISQDIKEILYVNTYYK